MDWSVCKKQEGEEETCAIVIERSDGARVVEQNSLLHEAGVRSATLVTPIFRPFPRLARKRGKVFGGAKIALVNNTDPGPFTHAKPTHCETAARRILCVT